MYKVNNSRKENGINLFKSFDLITAIHRIRQTDPSSSPYCGLGTSAVAVAVGVSVAGVVGVVSVASSSVCSRASHFSTNLECAP